MGGGGRFDSKEECVFWGYKQFLIDLYVNENWSTQHTAF